MSFWPAHGSSYRSSGTVPVYQLTIAWLDWRRGEDLSLGTFRSIGPIPFGVPSLSYGCFSNVFLLLTAHVVAGVGRLSALCLRVCVYVSSLKQKPLDWGIKLGVWEGSAPLQKFFFTPPPLGDGGLFSSDFFVCLFLCFFVSLSARLRENGWTDLHEIFREGLEWPWDNVIGSIRVNRTMLGVGFVVPRTTAC